MTALVNRLGDGWWAWVAPLAVQVALLALVVWAADLALRRRGWPQVRYALWLLVLVKLVLPPSFALPGAVGHRLVDLGSSAVALLGGERNDSPAATGDETGAALLSLPATATDDERRAARDWAPNDRPPMSPDVAHLHLPPAPLPAAFADAMLDNGPGSVDAVPAKAAVRGAAAAEAASSATAEPRLSPRAWAMLGAGSVSLALVVLMVARARRFARAVADDSRSDPAAIRAALERAARRLGLRRLPRVVLTDRVRSAAVFGVVRPAVLLPRRSWRAMTADQLEHVLLHELAHVRRGDMVANALQMLLVAAFWFHPLVWLAGRRLRHLRELCCDATVAALLRGRTAEYRRTLIEAARAMVSRGADTTLGLLGLFETASRLRQRLDHLRRPAWRHRGLRLAVTAGVTAAMLAFVLPMARLESRAEPPDAERAAAPARPPVWISLMLRTPIRSLDEHQHCLMARGVGRAVFGERLIDLEIRTADQKRRVAFLRDFERLPPELCGPGGPAPQTGLFIDGGMNRETREVVGPLPDGDYVAAVIVEGVRCSNVARLRIDSTYKPQGQPVLRLIPLPLGPEPGLPHVGMVATGPDPLDEELTNMAATFPALIVDGVKRQTGGGGWSGPVGPLQPGQRMLRMFDLARYKPDVPVKPRYKVKAKVGRHESAEVTLPGEDALAAAWDEAGPGLGEPVATASPLRGNVTGRDGRPITGCQISLEGGGREFRCQSDGAGYYAFGPVPPGEYRLAAHPPDVQKPLLRVAGLVVKEDRTLVQNLDFQWKPPGISGQVTWRDGPPAKGIELWATYVSDDGRITYERTATTDRDGRYLFYGPFARVSYLGVSHVWPMPQPRRNLEGHHTDVDFRLPATLAEGSPWGEKVRGIEAMVRPDKVQWDPGETPTLRADIHNANDYRVRILRYPVYCDLELDGRRYRRKVEHELASDMTPRRYMEDVAVALDGAWTGPDGKAPDLAPGRHAIRLLVEVDPLQAGAERFEAATNTIEIDVLPPRGADGAPAPGAAERAAAPPADETVEPVALRTQSLKDRNEAANAIDAARQVFEAYSKRFGPRAERTDQEAAAFEQAIAAYQAVAEKYPATEFDADARIRQADLHAYRGDTARAIEVARTTAARFAGTRYENAARFQVALHYLQREHDYAAALDWLEKTRLPELRPTEGMGKLEWADEYQSARQEYVKAHSLMVKCEVYLGRPDDAARRTADLMAAFPELADSLRGSLDREVDNALTDRTLKDIHPALKAWQAQGGAKNVVAEDGRWGKVVNGLRCSIEFDPPTVGIGQPLVVRLTILNTTERAITVRYQYLYAAKHLVIRDAEGKVITGRETGVKYNWPHPREFFQRIEPGRTFTAEIKGRAAVRSPPAAWGPGDREQQLLLDFHDMAHAIGKTGKFSATFRLEADEQAAAEGKALGFDAVWTGTLESGVARFAVSAMPREELDKAIARLQNGSDEQRREAIAVLAASADRQAVPALMAILAASDEQHYRAAAEALAAIGDASVIPDLVALYSLSAKYPKAGAGEREGTLLRTVEALEPDKAKLADFMAEVLASRASAGALSAASWYLANAAPERALPLLVNLTKSPDAAARRVGLGGLRRIAIVGDDQARRRIAPVVADLAAGDADANVRLEAIEALVITTGKAAVPALVAALKDADPSVRINAARWLGSHGGPDVIPALEAYLRSARSDREKKAAEEALKHVRQRADAGGGAAAVDERVAPPGSGDAEEERAEPPTGGAATARTGPEDVDADGDAPVADAADGAPAADAGEANQEKDSAAADPLIRRLIEADRRDAEQLSDEALAKAVEARADELVDLIMKEYEAKPHDFGFRHGAVRSLERLATPKARAMLLEIALGHKGDELPSMLAWASRAYVATLKDDKSEARKLLASDVSGVLNNALLALKGERIDAPLMARLEELMRFSDKEPNAELIIRRCAALVMAESPNDDFAAEKVAAVIAAIPDVERLANADETAWPGYYTIAETCYHQYMVALTRIRGRGADLALAEQMEDLKGRSRQLVAIARAGRGARSVREELWKVIADNDAEMLRAWAVAGLGRIGTEDDLPGLRQLQVNDPLARDPGGCMPPAKDEKGEVIKIYPVRRAAREAIKEIEKRTRSDGAKPALAPTPDAAGGGAVGPATAAVAKPGGPEPRTPDVTALADKSDRILVGTIERVNDRTEHDGSVHYELRIEMVLGGTTVADTLWFRRPVQKEAAAYKSGDRVLAFLHNVGDVSPTERPLDVDGRESVFTIEGDTVDGPIGKRPLGEYLTQISAADDEPPWGEPAGGLRLRLAVLSRPAEWTRQTMSMAMEMELQNVSLTPIRLAELDGVLPVIEAVDAARNTFAARPYVALAPWEGHLAMELPPGAVIRWPMWFDRMRFDRAIPAGTLLRLRVALQRRRGGAEVARSNYLELAIKDEYAMEPHRTISQLDQWFHLDLVYREDAASGGDGLALHIDRDGRVELLERITRTTWRPDPMKAENRALLIARGETVLPRERLDELARGLEAAVALGLGSREPEAARPGEPVIRLSMTWSGALVREFPLRQADAEPALAALRKLMRGAADDLWARIGEENKGWGESVEGAQVRLRAEEATVRLEDDLVLKADVRHRGPRDLWCPNSQAAAELEVDGKLYRWVGTSRIKSGSFGRNRERLDILFTLSAAWQQPGGEPLILSAGKHKVRVAFLLRPAEGGQSVRVVSNALEIDVRDAGAGAGATDGDAR